MAPLSEPIAVATHGRFHWRPATRSGAPLLLGFHGYGENAERSLAELSRIPGLEGWTLAAIEGLHAFYDRKSGEVVRSWMTRADRELAIADNLAYVGAVLARLRDRAGFDAWHACGFSQGTAMAWRAAVGSGVPCAAVVALGGDVPPELSAHAALAVPRALLGRGRRDEWYTVEKLAADRELLAARGVAAEVCEFDAGHEWTDDFRRAAARFLTSR